MVKVISKIKLGKAFVDPRSFSSPELKVSYFDWYLSIVYGAVGFLTLVGSREVYVKILTKLMAYQKGKFLVQKG